MTKEKKFCEFESWMGQTIFLCLSHGESRDGLEKKFTCEGDKNFFSLRHLRADSVS
jgi:hypothetical protein